MTDTPAQVLDLEALERLAKAVGPKRWKAFISSSSNTFAVTCARTAKEVISWSGFDASRTAETVTKRRNLCRFISAMDPRTVLALLAAARAKPDDRLAEAVELLRRIVKNHGSYIRELPGAYGLSDLAKIDAFLATQSEGQSND